MHIVAIGGGTGLYTLLRGLKQYPIDLTAIVTTADNGGSTGRLCDEYGVLPPGDIRRCLVALSDSRDVMQEVCEHRFTKGTFDGHTVGNLLITALEELYGKEEGIQKTAEILNIHGTVLPVTTDDMRLQATLSDGSIVQGESAIDCLAETTDASIDVLATQQQVTVEPAVKEAIRHADAIVLGPGDLYTSIIPNLLVDGVTEAIAYSEATVICNCNVMTKPGETDHFAVEDFVKEIERYLGSQIIEYILHNTRSVRDTELLAKYASEKKEPIFVREGSDQRLCGRDLITEPNLIRHDPHKLAQAVMGCV